MDFLSCPIILRCSWTVDHWMEDFSSEKAATSKPFFYENQMISQARVKINQGPSRDSVIFTLMMFSYLNEKFGCWRLGEVSYTCSSIPNNETTWGSKFQPRMKPLLAATASPLQSFTDTYELPIDIESFRTPFTVIFDLSLNCTAKDKDVHCLVDSTWRNQLWDAATNKTLTDVDFEVGNETISAHSFILSAWSPNNVIATTTHLQSFTIDYASSSTFRRLLKFVYTGTLESISSVEKQELFAAAAKWDLKQLMTLCRPNSDASEIESLTTAFASF